MTDAPTNPEAPRRAVPPPLRCLPPRLRFRRASFFKATSTNLPRFISCAPWAWRSVRCLRCALPAREPPRAAGLLRARCWRFFRREPCCTAAHGSQPRAAPTVLNYADGDEVTLTGYVARSGSLRTGRDVHESLDFAVEEAQFDGEAAQAVTGSVRLNLYVPGSRSGFGWETEEDGLDEAAAPPVFDYGQRLRIRAKLRPPTNFRNPGNMDYVGWLRGQGVAVLGSAKSTDVDVLPGAGGSRMERARGGRGAASWNTWSGCGRAPYAGLFQAMVLGERGLVGREQRLEFQRSGTFHLLVVSGMNVAIFAVFLLWLMRRLRLPGSTPSWRRLRSPAAMPGLPSWARRFCARC